MVVAGLWCLWVPKRLRSHGLIKKIGRTYKYYVTGLSKQVIALGLKLKNLNMIPELSAAGIGSTLIARPAGLLSKQCAGALAVGWEVRHHLKGIGVYENHRRIPTTAAPSGPPKSIRLANLLDLDHLRAAQHAPGAKNEVNETAARAAHI